jgi:hypothetical protein
LYLHFPAFFGKGPDGVVAVFFLPIILPNQPKFVLGLFWLDIGTEYYTWPLSFITLESEK